MEIVYLHFVFLSNKICEKKSVHFFAKTKPSFTHQHFVTVTVTNMIEYMMICDILRYELKIHMTCGVCFNEVFYYHKTCCIP